MKLILPLMLYFFTSVVSAVTLNNVVVFGDSLSDNGNLYEYMQHELPSSPPYFEGRFSNGPVWVERLVSSYYSESPTNHLLDYAFGGAGVSEDPNSEMLFTLTHEIDSYLLSHQDTADKNSLFIVWIGANNYLELPDNVQSAVDEVNKGIKHSLQRLVDAGAKHILVFNLPDLGKSPYAKLTNSAELLTRYTLLHNDALLTSMNQLMQTNPSVQWLQYDVQALVNLFMLEFEQYGFTNVAGTCYGSGLDKSAAHPTLKHSMINVATQINSNFSQDACEGYLFFDPVHPTGKAHELMALMVRQLLDNSDIKFS